MDQTNVSEVSPEQQRLQLHIFLLVGVFDIVLGTALAFIGPEFIGGEPVIDTFLRIGGGILAGSGIWMIWWGRARYCAAQGTESADPVFKVEG